jgi:hypothetical protein
MLKEWSDRDAKPSRGLYVEAAIWGFLIALGLVGMVAFLATPASAREAQGNCKTKTEHRARSPKASATATPQDSGRFVYYKNCTAARAAGAAPIRRGEPGYAPHLDRDGDGIACE